MKLAGGEITRVSIHQTVPGLGYVLFLNAEQISFVESMAVKLLGFRLPDYVRGGALPPTFWDKFFTPIAGKPWRPEFETYPVISQIEFFNAERTQAGAHVRARLQGATIVLEKIGQSWRVKARVNDWIS